MTKKKETNIVVKESNTIARARIEPKTSSVWEERVIALLWSKIRTSDKEFKPQYILSVSELNDARPLSSLEHKELIKAVGRLMQKYYYAPDGKGGLDHWGIFTHIHIDKEGNITATISNDMCSHLLELREQFALRLLPEFSALSGIYAQPMYRYLNSLKNIGEYELGLEVLHEFLQTPESFRENFGDFRINVLEPVAKELNAKTSLKYDWKTICKGRGGKVIAIKFTFPQPKETTKTPKEKPIRQVTNVETPKPKPEDILTPEQMAADIAKFKAERGA